MLVLFAAVMSLYGCTRQLNKRVTLWRNDKIPYGTYYAYNNLQYIFTDAKIETSNKSPATFYHYEEGSDAYIIIGHTIRPDEKELMPFSITPLQATTFLFRPSILAETCSTVLIWKFQAWMCFAVTR